MHHNYSALNPQEPLKLEDIINVDDIQSMMDNFYNLTHIPTAIVDINGKVLTSAGWQNVCINFHRINPESNKNCIESDTQLTTGIPEGEFKLYKCKNGMWDLATPIIIDDKHLGNLFMGQFFFDDDKIDYDFFRSRALQYGFNDEEYIKAIDSVPKISSEMLNYSKGFLIRITKYISQLSYNNTKLTHLLEEKNTMVKLLSQSEQNFRVILNATQEAIIMYDRQGKIIAANDTAVRRVNRSMEHVIGSHISDIFSSENSEGHLKHNSDVFTTGKSIRFEDEYDGKFYIHNLYPVFDKDNVVSVVCYNQDVTAYRTSEELIEHLASFPKLNPNPIIEIDLTGKITFYNEATSNILRELKSPDDVYLFIPGDIQEILKTFYGSQHSTTIRELSIKNRTFHEHIHYAKQLNVIRIYATDVTDNKKAEEQLRKLSSAVEHSPNSILITDARGRIEYVNPEFTKITGYTLEEVKGKNPRILKSGKTEPEVYKNLWQTITSGHRWQGAFQNKKKSGKLYWESVNISPVFNDHGIISHFVSVKEDITERIINEEQLKRLSRTLNALRHSGEALVRATDEESYLYDICNIIVEDCGHALVWIGFAENDKIKSVRPVASDGFETGYLENLHISWDDNIYGRGPTGTAIRTGRVSVCNNMLTDPSFMPWRKAALQRGYVSSIVFPLSNDGVTFGAISIYSKDVHPFSDDEISLLSELANDVSYGIKIIRLQRDHRKAEIELKKHKDNLESLVQVRTSELEKANQILLEAQKVAHIGHWQLDLINNKLTWSDEIFRIFGIEPNSFEATLEAFVSFIHPDDRDYVLQSFSKSVNEKTFYSIDHRIIRPNKETRFVHEQCVTYYSDTGNPLYSLGVCQDITEIKLAGFEIENHRNHLEELVKIRTEELAISNRQLKSEIEKEKQIELLLQESLEKERSLNELKSRFISTTSHEFRTPLTSILSSMQLIQRYRKKWTDEQIEDQFNKIKTSVINLTGLLDDILVISHSDSGRITLNRQKTNLQKFCEYIIDEIKHLVHSTHKFSFQYKSTKKQFDIDPKLMRFIILNLLTNAFKYSPGGGKVELLISYSSSKLKITVNDEGIGVPKDDIDNLFKPFFRSSNTSEIEGTGLGLSIVQRAVELHNGTIKCYPNKTKGTKFVVIIPGV